MFADGVEIKRFEGDNLVLALSGFVELSGNFVFEQQGSGDEQKILLGASGASAFLGVAGQGLRLSGLQLGMLLLANDSSGSSQYALHAIGQVALEGLAVLTLSGSVTVRANHTGGAVIERVAGVDVVFADGTVMSEIRGEGLSLDVAGFVSLSGNFSFAQSGSGASSQLRIGATSVNAFLGVDGGSAQAMGVQLSGGELGLVLYQGDTGYSYALQAGGELALLGVEGLQLSGAALMRQNATGSVVDETITVGTQQIQVQFAADETDITRVEGEDLQLNVADFVVLRGGFSFQKTGPPAAPSSGAPGHHCSTRSAKATVPRRRGRPPTRRARAIT